MTKYIDRILFVVAVLVCALFLVGCRDDSAPSVSPQAQSTLPHITTVSYYYAKPTLPNIHPPVSVQP